MPKDDVDAIAVAALNELNELRSELIDMGKLADADKIFLQMQSITSIIATKDEND